MNKNYFLINLYLSQLSSEWTDINVPKWFILASNQSGTINFEGTNFNSGLNLDYINVGIYCSM